MSIRMLSQWILLLLLIWWCRYEDRACVDDNEAAESSREDGVDGFVVGAVKTAMSQI